jgi:hypothetical protein
VVKAADMATPSLGESDSHFSDSLIGTRQISTPSAVFLEMREITKHSELSKDLENGNNSRDLCAQRIAVWLWRAGPRNKLFKFGLRMKNDRRSRLFECRRRDQKAAALIVRSSRVEGCIPLISTPNMKSSTRDEI